jgi:hypothetical protein
MQNSIEKGNRISLLPIFCRVPGPDFETWESMHPIQIYPTDGKPANAMAISSAGYS